MRSRIRQLLGWGGVTVLSGGAVLIAAAPVQAAPAQNAAMGDAVIRAAHFSPTTPGVDVYLGSFRGTTSKEWLSGVSYGAVSPYERLAPGLYTVAMRPHGAPASSKPVLSWTLNAKSGAAYTVAGVGAGRAVKGVVIPDDLSVPPKGRGRVRVIQASSRAPRTTVVAKSGPVIARDAAFATTTAYATVPAGTWKVEASGGTPALRSSTSVQVMAGSVQSVLVLDAKAKGITIRTVLDSAAAGVAPVGWVSAGGGGTAVRPPRSGDGRAATVGLAAAGLITVCGGLGLARRRRHRPVEAHAAE